MIVIDPKGSQLIYYRLKETFLALIPMRGSINLEGNIFIPIGQTLLKINTL